MSQIDVDALKAEILKNQYTVKFCLEHGIERSISLEMLWIVLDNAPKFERPQGKWIEHEDGYNICPYCKNRTAFSYPFCPYCGAQMDEGKEGSS